MIRVLVLFGDEDRRRSIQVALGQLGCEVDATAALADCPDGAGGYNAVFCPADDLPIPASGARIIALAPRDQPDRAVAALGRGASDALLLPLDEAELAVCLGRLRRGPARPPTADEPAPMAGMVGASQVMRDVFATIEKLARHKANVLITGESGTGKELVARAIHQLSARSGERFVAVNCGAIPATLLESELFGFVRGAFTDAVRDKPGLFEQADRGTLFLDEIGELSPALQVKLLRALQEEEIRRLGDNASIKIDVRVVAATLRNLEADIASGQFREDLYYRLNVLPIALPPLRDRPEDIPPLVDHFIARYAAKHAAAGPCAASLSPEAMALLCDYRWPGNIRELENAIERAMVLCDGPVIGAELLGGKLRGRGRAATADPVRQTLAGADLSIKKATRRVEHELIRRALEETNGNRTNAAKLLEISHRALLYKIKEYGLG